MNTQVMMDPGCISATVRGSHSLRRGGGSLRCVYAEWQFLDMPRDFQLSARFALDDKKINKQREPKGRRRRNVKDSRQTADSGLSILQCGMVVRGLGNSVPKLGHIAH
jgi:hypothetical protein